MVADMLPNAFYIVCFSISILVSIVGISIGLSMIFIVALHRQCRTINNMMMCNIAAATILYGVLQIISAGYGLQNDWRTNQPVCAFRAYLYTAVCTLVGTSYTFQAISRLFFMVMYKHRRLLTWRVHWYLIVLHYLISLIGPVPSVFVGNGSGFEIESRLCLCSTKVFSSALLAATSACVTPLSVALIIYGRILYVVRQSTRRVTAVPAINNTGRIANQLPPLNIRREIKLIKNIVVLVNVLACSGIPYVTMLIWHFSRSEQPPVSLYLPTMLVITIAFAFKMIFVLNMNSSIKNVVIDYWQRVKLF